MILRERTKSNAVDASNPREELSQHCTRARVVIISAILTRFRSPPETPRTKLSPTRVFSVCTMFSILSSMSLTEALNSERETSGKRPLGPGVFVESAKLSVWPTVRVGIWMSSETREDVEGVNELENHAYIIPSALYTISPLYILAISSESMPAYRTSPPTR